MESRSKRTENPFHSCFYYLITKEKVASLVVSSIFMGEEFKLHGGSFISFYLKVGSTTITFRNLLNNFYNNTKRPLIEAAFEYMAQIHLKNKLMSHSLYSKKCVPFS